ncbi:hypothetical protein ABL78_6087 [Leptomonas seymouri]|uniref:Uncharacterized protein n=1 Tax=Leptomonas seymouri TaxID=5684 RepID=A0A0N0P442_LEPSE|nr:hypothetical protein ABL78_6087 [Leptomonas seymouri]|eukprot:KPI84859.1 hypothetical protein ABL78_6087 [Leptomonas seymouri]
MPASAYPNATPGDRYLTREPCGPQCCGAAAIPSGRASSSEAHGWVAVRPYSYVFRAPVKGRWLGWGLLDLFLHEFAFVPCAPDKDEDVAISAASSTASAPARSAVCPILLQSSAAGHSEGGGATLDRRFTLPAYIEELCDGALWLHGREAECRAAGRRYRNALVELAHARGAGHGGCDGDDAVAPPQQNLSLPSSPAPSASSADSACTPIIEKAAKDDAEWKAWCRTVLWLSRLPSETEIDAFMPLLHRHGNLNEEGPLSKASAVNSHASSPSCSSPPLVLRQRDTVYHRVWRREGRMFEHPTLQVLRCDLARAIARRGAVPSPSPFPSSTQALALIVVNKPPGPPVHPSGCYRKNSVTSILEDVFGGCDGGLLYDAEEHFTEEGPAGSGQPFRPYASIQHRQGGFELMRVFVRHPSAGCAVEGVSMEDWRLLKELLLRRRTMAAGDQRGKGRCPKPSVDTPEAAPAWKRPREDGSERQTVHDSEERVRPRSGSIVAAADESEDANSETADPALRRSVSLPANYSLKTFVVHRLDAATSGVLLFGLDSDTAQRTAVAIANKRQSSGGSDDDADDGADVPFNEPSPALPDEVPAGPPSSSQKVYVARVHGRVDLAALACTQHHCTLRRRSPARPPNEAQSGVNADLPCGQSEAVKTSVDDEELVVHRPIGCVDHHHSLYWCPDAALTEVWQQQQQRELTRREAAGVRTAAAQVSSGAHDSGQNIKRGKGGRTPEAIAAKRERMRRLTRGAAGGNTLLVAPLPDVSASGEGSECWSAAPLMGGDEAGTALRVQQYMQTLRSATTLLRVDHYDAAADQTVVQCTLGTGRTHQLRVHLASLGHPIAQDGKYIAMEAFLRHIGAATLEKFQGPLERREGGAEGCSASVGASPPPTAPSAEPQVLTNHTEVRGGRQASDTPMQLFYAVTLTHSNRGTGKEATEDVRGRETAEATTPAWKSAIFADSRTARGCVCPDAICLHAWRYTLAYADSKVVRVEVPLPTWAHA